MAARGAAWVLGCDKSIRPWTCLERTRLLAPNGKANDYFGYALSASLDHTVLIGATGATGATTPTAGAAYVFDCSGNKCDDCTAFADCEQCTTASASCGWCYTTGSCISGTTNGPVVGSCSPEAWWSTRDSCPPQGTLL